MINIVSEAVTESKLKEIIDLAESSIGPHGRLKVLQTKAGGYAMITTTSSRLFDFISAKDPVSQILLTGFSTHQHLLKNGGLFLASLSCNFYLAHCGSSLPRSTCIEMNIYVHERIKQELNENFVTKILDIGNASNMLTLVKSILRSKPVCQLTEDEIEHLSIKILKAFFVNADSQIETQYGLVIVPLQGPAVIQSHLISGIVLKLPKVISLSEKLQTVCKGRPKLVVVLASLAGDQQVINGSLFPEDSEFVPINDVTFGAIWRLVESFVSAGVDIVCCQKVVHPSVRKYLEEKNVLVIDRLGYQSAKYVYSTTKVEPVESIFDKFTDANLGSILKADVHAFCKERFLILHPCIPDQFRTIMLCANDENTLDELKVALTSAEQSLFHVIKEPKVVFGGGCFEAQIAAFVCSITRKDVSSEEKLKYRRLAELSEAKWFVGLQSIARSFVRIAKSIHKQAGDCYIDSTFNHLWVLPPRTEITTINMSGLSCCCGCIDYVASLDFEPLMLDKVACSISSVSERVEDDLRVNLLNAQALDSLYLKRESISSAFELCNTVLRVGCSLESQV